MTIDPESLFLQLVLRHAVEMIDGGHRAPADIQRRMNVGLRPFENLSHFVPVGHVFIGQRFHGRAGNDETVKLAVAHFLPRLVER